MKNTYSKVTSMTFAALLFSMNSLYAQSLDVEKTFDPPSLTKDSYCGHVDYDQTTEVTSLDYVEASDIGSDFAAITFKTYFFDKDLNFMNEEIKKFNWIDFMKLQMGKGDDEYKRYQWFNYKGESFTREWTDVQQRVGGTIDVTKRKVTYNWAWPLSEYLPTFEKPIKMTLKREDQEDKMHIYTYMSNTKTGDTYLIVGNKSPKGSDVKAQHARNFQIIKFSSDQEVTYLQEFKFEKNMCISYSKIMKHEDEMLSEEVPDDEILVPDVVNGELYLVFAPVTGGGKDNMNPNMGESRLVILNENGEISNQIDFNAPTSGWVIKDMVKSTFANDYYFFGPAKDEIYVNKVTTVISPLDVNQAVNDIKFKNYQIMKISEGKLAWINSTPLEDFATKASAPPSQKGLPEYEGKNFNRRVVFITKGGELMLAGQNYTKKTNEDKVTHVKTVEIKYKDLILAHFDDQGILKRSYGVKRDNMNKHSKAIVTPMDIYLTPNGDKVCLVYGEIEGMKGGWSPAGFTVSKKKLLYFPAVAEVDLEKATMSDFTFLGADADGKQEYYTNPNVGQMMSADGKKLILVGEDKPGKLVWLAKMNVE